MDEDTGTPDLLDTAYGIATRDQALAYWTDPANFPTYISPVDEAFNAIVANF